MHQAITAEKSPHLFPHLEAFFQVSKPIVHKMFSFSVSCEEKVLHLFPHLGAFFNAPSKTVHKIFTISGFCGIPPLTTEAFNPSDSFAKSPSTCFLTQKHFCGVCDKTFTKYLHIPDLCALPQKAFNSPSKASALKPLLPVSSLNGHFLTPEAKHSQNIYIFNLPQQRNVALLLFVKGKKTRNWIGAF